MEQLLWLDTFTQFTRAANEGEAECAQGGWPKARQCSWTSSGTRRQRASSPPPVAAVTLAASLALGYANPSHLITCCLYMPQVLLNHCHMLQRSAAGPTGLHRGGTTYRNFHCTAFDNKMDTGAITTYQPIPAESATKKLQATRIIRRFSTNQPTIFWPFRFAGSVGRKAAVECAVE